VVFTVWFAKLMEDGKRVTVDGTSVPVPLRPTDSGLLPVMVIAAERGLAAKGVNVTPIVQKPLTASVAGLTGQLFVCAKSPGLVPVMIIPFKLATPGPLFVMVTPCEALVVLRVWFAKVMETGKAVTFVFALRIWKDDAQLPEMPTVLKQAPGAETLPKLLPHASMPGPSLISQ